MSPETASLRARIEEDLYFRLRADAVTAMCRNSCTHHREAAEQALEAILRTLQKSGYTLLRDTPSEPGKPLPVAPPRRGDEIEAWIRHWRESYRYTDESHAFWAIDGMLDEWRQLADTGRSPGEVIEAAEEEDGSAVR